MLTDPIDHNISQVQKNIYEYLFQLPHWDDGIKNTYPVTAILISKCILVPLCVVFNNQ